MFQGETAITIDDKGRLAIPTAYREIVARECGNRLVLTYNPFEAGCLYLYPMPVWLALGLRPWRWQCSPKLFFSMNRWPALDQADRTS